MATKTIKSGSMPMLKGGASGKVGKQGGATRAVSGKVSIPGNSKGGGKWAKGGGSGYVGKQGKSTPAVAGKVSVAKGC